MNKTATTATPFLDLVSPHLELEEELVTVFREALREGRFIGGPAVENFEKNFAEFTGSRYCIGVASGTDALRFALMASGIGPGQTVATVANTFIATTEAITQAGAEPAFVDIEEATYNMDPDRLLEYLEAQCDTGSDGRPVDRRTRSTVTAVIPVHLYGQSAQMDRIMEIAGKWGLTVIEDACQAHGSRCYFEKEGAWRTAGSIGKAGAFSFYPGKNLGACGEAGAVTTNDGEIASKIRMVREHGQIRKYYHESEGYNGRLDAIQAGFLDVKLKKLKGWNESRREAALYYNELLGGSKNIILPLERPGSEAVYHLYVVRVKNRGGLQQRLQDNGLATGLHYPLPLHLQKAYRRLGYKRGALPVTEMVADEILSLPMFPGITREQQQGVCRLILDFTRQAD